MSHLDKAIWQADRAQTILNDDLVQFALDEIEQAITDQWTACPIDDYERQCELKRLLWSAQQFKNIFITMVANGKFAKDEILHREKMRRAAERYK